MKAICILTGSVVGVIKFYQSNSEDLLEITGYIDGLSKGLHGFHVHEYGDLSNGCTSAGEHFNPFNKNHGNITDYERHLGDLGNINAIIHKGRTYIDIKDNLMSLYGPYNILGRSLVVHNDPDDLGRSTHPLSKISGNSGGRLACGIIGVSNY
ncbi:superoxide dismutase precursor [Mythimna separata entomopoxvirus 'L']|uniref:superoxide dismutase n=1 Tax=Mythimna separata entomopoxvirus 'L' TaxID=1293572 RepID=A0A916KQ06_9POXV|nr:superoxide dismutase precursor [Mythimna separata entomopoxvirus 'L']CCU56224.1 Cu/Zn superoxide dismutase [Mythimna separata entomopoxvirus 'L']